MRRRLAQDFWRSLPSTDFCSAHPLHLEICMHLWAHQSIPNVQNPLNKALQNHVGQWDLSHQPS